MLRWLGRFARYPVGVDDAGGASALAASGQLSPLQKSVMAAIAQVRLGGGVPEGCSRFNPTYVQEFPAPLDPPRPHTPPTLAHRPFTACRAAPPPETCTIPTYLSLLSSIHSSTACPTAHPRGVARSPGHAVRDAVPLQAHALQVRSDRSRYRSPGEAPTPGHAVRDAVPLQAHAI